MGLFDKLKGISHPIILHADRGATYSLLVYNDIYKDYNIIRSMSRTGTPTNNSKMESINRWIKAEIEVDWDIDSYHSFSEFIKYYIDYYNYMKSTYALNYNTPVQYKMEHRF